MDNLDQIFNPESNSFWNLLLATGVLIAGFLVAKLVRRRLRTFLGRYEVEEYAGAMLARIAGWSIVLLSVILGLSIMGVDMVPVVLLIVVVVVLVLLSAKTLIENWAAGLLLQARGPYRPGDRIETMGYIGYVETTNVRSVVIRTGDGQIVHIPNIDVLGNPIVNRTGHEGARRSSVTFGVAYGTDLEAAVRLLTEAAASVAGVRDEPKPPMAFIESLGDTTANIELRFWHDHADRHLVRSAVRDTALQRLDAASIAMPFPTQELIVSGSLDG
jgi:small-conductance mechanosensitive channel